MVVIFEYIWDIKMDLLLGLVVSVLFILAAEFRYFIRKERMRWGRRILLLCLGVYFSLLFALTISPVYGGWSLSNIGKNINLTPFQVLEVAALDYVNFFGNLILFVPFGILLVLLSYRCRNIFVTAAFGLILSIGIEVMQLFSLRSTDIDDVLLNTCGAVFGFLIGKILLHIFRVYNVYVKFWVKAARYVMVVEFFYCLLVFFYRFVRMVIQNECQFI